MSHELAASLKAIPYYEYGEKPKEGSEYWNEMERSEIPGRGVDLDYTQTFEAGRALDFASGDRLPSDRNTPFDLGAAMENTEGKFLDELYGNDRDAQLGQGEDPSVAGALARGEDTTIWGLDLRRVTPNEDWDVRSEEFYEHMTKGDVDWASYRNDERYQKAFKALGYEIEGLGTDAVPSKQGVSWIRHANKSLGGDVYGKNIYGSGQWKWNSDYDEDHIVKVGKDLYIDGTRQERLSEKYAQGKGRLQINHSFKPLAQIQQKKAQVVRPDLKIDKVSVQRPTNLPASFGKV